VVPGYIHDRQGAGELGVCRPEFEGANMMAMSVHDKLKKIRKPRVHITYDVETEGATEVKELPFVVGVMGDFSGDPTEPLKSLKDRKFISIDRENFDEVMKRMTPGLNMKVENTLAGDGSQMAVNLKFKSMDDFDPAAVVEQVPALKKLMETRNQLRDLMAKADSSDKLESLLENILQDQNQLDGLKKELGVNDPE
jgi:type VI secretion system protein ImpB